MRKLFDKILIANRGEIAIRIMRTAHEMGIKTVAVYNSYDKNAEHTKVANEAYYLGDGELRETYLNIQRIIEIAKLSNAQAIHPGYGFLSENPLFAKACEDAQIIFIGPKSESMLKMGNKIEARKFAKSINVPVTPGFTGTKKELLEAAAGVGFPVLIKAAAGGGGKAMKIVRNQEQLEPALEAASREAKNYFNDETVYLEKFIDNPRHIEVQILGDTHGNYVHLFERECSIQRRYQKIIEESPSPTLTPEIRAQICKTAIDLAKQIGYVNAGTLEFLVDENLNFYFLEMNTRIQVEHPVTEMVTGIDIVEEQIMIAAGFPLSIQQDFVQQNGHAIECRIYAENPENNFLPSPGAMTLYHAAAGHHIRVDASISGKNVVENVFDPMISKLIVWDSTRELAIKKMNEALKTYVIQGIDSNIPFLLTLMSNQNYRQNKISTNFCDNNLTDLIDELQNLKSQTETTTLIAAHLFFEILQNQQAKSIWQHIGYWRNQMQFEINIDKKLYNVVIKKSEKNKIDFEVDKTTVHCELRKTNEDSFEFFCDKKYFTAYVSKAFDGKTNITINGFNYQLHRSDNLLHKEVFDSNDFSLHSEQDVVISPMHGKVLKVNVSDGDLVKKGATLLIIEAMKMENNIVATKDAEIEKVNVNVGQTVESNMVLIEYKN